LLAVRIAEADNPEEFPLLSESGYKLLSNRRCDHSTTFCLAYTNPCSGWTMWWRSSPLLDK